MDNKAVGLEWQRRREDASIGQDDAAKSLGVSRVTLSRYETGARPIPGAILAKMGLLYDVAEPDTREADPITEIVERGQAEQAAWVLEFAAKLLEAGAQQIRQRGKEFTLKKKATAAVAAVDKPMVRATRTERADALPKRAPRESSG